MLPAGVTLTALIADMGEFVLAFGAVVGLGVAIRLGWRALPKVVGIATGGKK